MKTKRAFLEKPGHLIIEEIDLKMDDNHVLIKVASCGLCTWELNHWGGLLQTTGYPYSLGHEFAGTVIEVGKNVTKFKVGDKVASLTGRQGFSEYALCHPNSTFKLADHIDPKYALGEPLKCVTTVLQATNPAPGDYGVVLGCGPMGLWCTMALSGNFLAGLIAIDIDDEKLALAKKYGATHVINSKKEDVVARLAEITDGRLADFVIEGTGIPALLNVAQDYLKPTGRGKLLLMSSHKDTCPEFDFRKAVDKCIDLHVPHPRHSLDNFDDMRRAVALINNGTFQIQPLITHEFKLSQINEAFETLANRPAGYLKGIVVPD